MDLVSDIDTALHCKFCSLLANDGTEVPYNILIDAMTVLTHNLKIKNAIAISKEEKWREVARKYEDKCDELSGKIGLLEWQLNKEKATSAQYQNTLNRWRNASNGPLNQPTLRTFTNEDNEAKDDVFSDAGSSELSGTISSIRNESIHAAAANMVENVQVATSSQKRKRSSVCLISDIRNYPHSEASESHRKVQKLQQDFTEVTNPGFSDGRLQPTCFVQSHPSEKGLSPPRVRIKPEPNPSPVQQQRDYVLERIVPPGYDEIDYSIVKYENLLGETSPTTQQTPSWDCDIENLLGETVSKIPLPSDFSDAGSSSTGSLQVQEDTCTIGSPNILRKVTVNAMQQQKSRPSSVSTGKMRKEVDFCDSQKPKSPAMNSKNDDSESLASIETNPVENQENTPPMLNTPCENTQKRSKRPQEKKHRCDKCNKMFTTVKSLKKHTATHTDNARFPFHCSTCPRKFAVYGTLHAHIAKFHSPQLEKKFQCSLCDQKFLKKVGLRMHLTKKHNMLYDDTD